MYAFLPFFYAVYYFPVFKTQHFFPRWRKENFTRGNVPIPDAVIGAFHCKTQPFFTFLQSVFSVLFLCYIIYSYYSGNNFTHAISGRADVILENDIAAIP